MWGRVGVVRQGSPLNAMQYPPGVAPSGTWLLHTAELPSGGSHATVRAHPPTQPASCPPSCRAARALDTLMKELCVPLGAYIKGFPAPSRLHPFERALLELTVGAGTYERVLARVEALRRSTVEVRKGGKGD